MEVSQKNIDIEDKHSQEHPISLKRMRFAVSSFYFGQGIAFASWASRIPDIKHNLELSDAALGTILLALPAGQLCTMPLSARLVSLCGSRKIIVIAAPLYVLALCLLGLASSSLLLMASLFLFGIIGNIANISINTQGVEAEKLYGKSIMASFHGAWSVAGFTGALIGLAMINLEMNPFEHFCFIILLIFANTLINHRFLVSTKPSSNSNSQGNFFVKPDASLALLGVVGFCCMGTEGAMFDWSGVYFKEIVEAPARFVVVGYASFMVMMATGRFIGDRIISSFGRKRTIQYSGLTISTGMAISVFFPSIIPATLGFMLVGLGVSSVVPTLYSIAGKNKRISPGTALAMVSSISYFGFLLGPPLIGYISAISSLRYSYALIGCFGLLIAFLVSRAKAFDEV
ncbi:MFS transporter [Desertivirga brevis]|uniref:MFS transporter n=1 Tax=Desertivirga brevis TaxID=2810310 RepID=UPI001A95F982|nr:MFS transporter [Pedobacter sp. SYSU D00873]